MDFNKENKTGILYYFTNMKRKRFIKIDLPLGILPNDVKNLKIFINHQKRNVNIKENAKFVDIFIRYNKNTSLSLLSESLKGFTLLIKFDTILNTNVIEKTSLMGSIENKLVIRRFSDFEFYSKFSKKIFKKKFLKIEPICALKTAFFKKYFNKPFSIDIIPPFYTIFSLKKNQILISKNFKHLKNNYRYDSISLSKKIYPIGLDKRSFSKTKSDEHININFLNDEIPSFPIKKNILKKTEVLFTIGLLGKMYKNRPVWIKRKFEKYFSDFQKKLLKSIVNLFSYKFYKGSPFENCFVRFGFDPRVNKKNSVYQSFQIENFIKITNYDPNVNKNIKKNFAQLIDIRSSFLKKLYHSSKFRLNSFLHYRHGWFTKKEVFLIKKTYSRYKVRK
jgi:hypothetical protein